MTRFAVDSSVIVAAAIAGHPRHNDASDELESRLGAQDQMLIPGHVLAEVYAVVTRMPPPGRLSPESAGRTIQSFVDAADGVVTLSGDEYLGLIRRAVSHGIAGGRIYDAVIAETARVARAELLLTFNTRHFAGLVPEVEVREPGAG